MASILPPQLSDVRTTCREDAAEISLKGLVEGLKNLADLGVRLSRFYRCASRRRFVHAKVADCFSGSHKPLQILQESDSAMGCHRFIRGYRTL